MSDPPLSVLERLRVDNECMKLEHLRLRNLLEAGAGLTAQGTPLPTAGTLSKASSTLSITNNENRFTTPRGTTELAPGRKEIERLRSTIDVRLENYKL